MIIKYKLSGATHGSSAEALEAIRQLIVCEFDTLEYVLGILSSMRYDPRGYIGLEKTPIEKEEANKGRNAQLPGL
jgi:hypothetical protein